MNPLESTTADEVLTLATGDDGAPSHLVLEAEDRVTG